MLPFSLLVSASLLHVTLALIRLPSFLSSGAILQTWRGYHTAAKLYGLAAPSEVVTVSCSAPDVPPFSTIADSVTGAWSISYNWPPGPTDWNDFDLTFGGSATPTPIVLTGVRWGDVVFCVGDGAALLPVSRASNGTVWLQEPHVLSSLSTVRLFPAVIGLSASPQFDFAPATATQGCLWGGASGDGAGLPCNTWTNASASNLGSVGEFSAVCLQTTISLSLSSHFGGNTVIGIIQMASNVSNVEDWFPPVAAPSAGVGAAASACNGSLPGGPAIAGGLYNGSYAPVAQYPARYAIVAIGGSGDAARLVEAAAAQDSVSVSKTYACLLANLIHGLRTVAMIGDFPVLVVGASDAGFTSIPSNSAAEGLWALRAAQSALLPSAASDVLTTTVTSALDQPSGGLVQNDAGAVASPYTLIVAERASLTMAYTAWWSYEVAGIGPLPCALAGPPKAAAPPASTGIPFCFAPGNFPNGTLSLIGNCAIPSAAFQVTASGDAAGPWLNATATITTASTTLQVTSPSLNASAVTYIRYGASSDCILYDNATSLPSPAFLFATSAPAPEVHAPLSSSTVQSSSESLLRKAASHLKPRSGGVEFFSKDFSRRDYLLQGTIRARAAAEAAASSASSVVKILAPTPVMGWNSWQSYRCNLDERLVRGIGDAFISYGLNKVGYNIVSLDDCFARTRNASGALTVEEVRFPSGMRATSDYLASLGLGFGAYTSQSSETCVGRPGTYNMEAIDTATWCEWGLQLIKVDDCGGTKWPSLNTSWILIREGLDKCAASPGGRPIILSVESCGSPSPSGCGGWIQHVGAQQWRTTGDLQLYWQSVVSNLDGNEVMAPLAAPGLVNDPDMLIVGHAGITHDEAKSHFASWCISAAPLLLSFDLTSPSVSPLDLAIISNPEVIAVDQDIAVIQGVRATPANATGSECWAKPLAAGGGNSSAVLLFNRANTTASVYCSWADTLPHIPPGTPCSVRDLWDRADLGSFTNGFNAEGLPPHGSMIVLVTPQ